MTGRSLPRVRLTIAFLASILPAGSTASASGKPDSNGGAALRAESSSTARDR
jgi:hypothetical protein